MNIDLLYICMYVKLLMSMLMQIGVYVHCAGGTRTKFIQYSKVLLSQGVLTMAFASMKFNSQSK